MTPGADPAITVALPYYDAPLDYVNQALTSVVSQHYSDWRVLVVDDSPRGSPQLQGLAQSRKDPRISYFRNESEHGIGAAWNAALDAADTELACILHSDDQLQPEYLARMARLSRHVPDAAIYFCGASVMGETGQPIFSLPDWTKALIWPRFEPTILAGESGVRALSIGDFIMCPTMMFRKNRLCGRRFSLNHKFTLDYRFIMETLFAGERIVGTHQNLYRYRRHSGQATVGLSMSGRRFEEELETLQWIAHTAHKLRWETAAWAATLRPTFRLNVVFECLRSLRAGRPFWPNLRFFWA
jgi:glycosyltransferase involved in cell wall biosynthesis